MLIGSIGSVAFFFSFFVLLLVPVSVFNFRIESAAATFKQATNEGIRSLGKQQEDRKSAGRVDDAKPSASRRTSAKTVIVFQGYKPPEKIDPRVDLKLLFQDGAVHHISPSTIHCSIGAELLSDEILNCSCQCTDRTYFSPVLSGFWSITTGIRMSSQSVQCMGSILMSVADHPFNIQETDIPLLFEPTSYDSKSTVQL